MDQESKDNANVKGKLDIAPLYEATSSQERWGMARVVRDFTVLLAIYFFLSANGMNHAFAFPAEAGPTRVVRLAREL